MPGVGFTDTFTGLMTICCGSGLARVMTGIGGDVMNFDFVTDRLAIGTSPESAQDVQDLMNSGITHVLNCRAEQDDARWFVGFELGAPGHYLWNGTEDWFPLHPTHKPVDWFQRGIEFAFPILSQAGPFKLLVHCKAGANRSGIMGYAILRAFGLTQGEAMAAIDTHRFITIAGLVETGWKRDAEDAVKELKYL